MSSKKIIKTSRIRKVKYKPREEDQEKYTSKSCLLEIIHQYIFSFISCSAYNEIINDDEVYVDVDDDEVDEGEAEADGDGGEAGGGAGVGGAEDDDEEEEGEDGFGEEGGEEGVAAGGVFTEAVGGEAAGE